MEYSLKNGNANYKIQIPQYGINYKEGYVGFTFGCVSLISQGIAHFTRFNRNSNIKVSHAFIVTGEDQCIEALVKDGVVLSSLSTYFNDENCLVFFRKPIDLDEKAISEIINAAKSRLNNNYNKKLLIDHVRESNIIWRFFKRIFGDNEKILFGKNQDQKWICSQLVSSCLNSSSKYKNKGILAKREGLISPQDLFEDQKIFEPWKVG